MTVKEMIAVLQKCDQKVQVYTEEVTEEGLIVKKPVVHIHLYYGKAVIID